MLKLIKNTNDKYLMFNQYHEKFESNNHSQLTTATKMQLECVRTLIECLDDQFHKFSQNVSVNSLTYVEFQSYNKQDNLETLLSELLSKSEEVKNQTDTVMIKLPTIDNITSDCKTSLKNTFVHNNRKNEKFLIFTNDPELIDLYKKL